MPEPVEQVTVSSRERARRLLGLDADRVVVALIGFIDSRKGADLLLDASLHAATVRPMTVVLAGRVSGDMIDVVQSHRGATNGRRIKVINRFLSVDHMWQVIAASDILALPYRRHIGSSGVLHASSLYVGRPWFRRITDGSAMPRRKWDSAGHSRQAAVQR